MATLLRKNVQDYDSIVVGTPTWWYKMACPVLAKHGTHIVDYAEQTGLGKKAYQLIDIDSTASRQ